MNYKIITHPCVSFILIQGLKTVKYGSTALPTQAMTEANKEVPLELLRTEVNKRYSSTLCSEAAKYAAATARHYLKKLEKPLMCNAITQKFNRQIFVQAKIS